MNQLALTTPALLFSAISLLLLAYTNRFLAYANVVRTLHARYKENSDAVLAGQIQNLRKRLMLTRTMQLLGIGSLLLCVLCMFLIYIELQLFAETVFGIALVMLIISLAISVREIQISVKALDLHLGDMEI
jgi:peptidoglycan/LPS O-acetylase OafA/YrhL